PARDSRGGRRSTTWATCSKPMMKGASALAAKLEPRPRPTREGGQWSRGDLFEQRSVGVLAENPDPPQGVLDRRTPYRSRYGHASAPGAARQAARWESLPTKRAV